MLKLHDIDSDQVLLCLWLWVGLVASDEQEGGVHDSRTCKHRGHERVVTWAIDEGDMSVEDHLSIAEGTCHIV